MICPNLNLKWKKKFKVLCSFLGEGNNVLFGNRSSSEEESDHKKKKPKARKRIKRPSSSTEEEGEPEKDAVC